MRRTALGAVLVSYLLRWEIATAPFDFAQGASQ